MSRTHDKLKITINEREFPLAATLRVAYKIQGQHGHKSYLDVFKEMADMPVEHQIGILWAAFEVANPEEAKTVTQTGFLNYCLDNMYLDEMMEKLQVLSTIMMGQDPDKKPETEGNSEMPTE